MWLLHQHESCILPEVDSRSATIGDIWKCDDCGKTWKVSTFYEWAGKEKAGWLPLPIRSK
jgi:ribosomal protein L37AE/L43A